MRFVRQIATLLFIIALPVALVTTNVRVIMNEPRVYSYATDHYNTTETTHISRSELLRASRELRDYFNSDDDTVFIRVMRDGQSISLFNARETAHLRDVKDALQTTFLAQETAIIFGMSYVVLVFLWARERSLRRLASEVLTSGLASLGVLLTFGLVALAGFDAMFDRFHIIAFTNGNWQFDPRTEHLIQMFPEEFWRDVTIWVGLATLVELVLLSAGAALVLRVTREQRIRTVKISGGLQPEAGAEGAEA